MHAAQMHLGETGFPGLIAPASLKQVADPAVLEILILGRRFPGLIAPASLKPRRRAHSASEHLEFSGVNCPGLIEATASFGLRFSVRPSFPGLIAPASLKRQQLVGVPVGQLVFRG